MPTSVSQGPHNGPHNDPHNNEDNGPHNNEEGDFSAAPAWAKALNRKLDMIVMDIQKRVSECEVKVSAAIKTADDAKVLVEEVREQQEDTAAKVEKLQKENEDLKKRLIEQEDRNRHCNLKIIGLHEPQDETPLNLVQRVRKFFQEKLELQRYQGIRLDECYRIGKKSPTKNRTIFLRFSFLLEKEIVWSARRKLKGESIHLQEDFSAETEEKRGKLYPYMKMAQSEKKKAFLSGDKLIIQGTSYTVETVDQSGISTQSNVDEKSDRNTYLFYGKTHPFSNFHPSSINIENCTYANVEQYFQHKRALFFKDNPTAEKILSTPDPVQQMRLGKVVRKDPRIEEQWKQVCVEIMREGVLAKFQQHGHLSAILLATGEKIIGEANPYDALWGTGTKLRDRQALNPSSWKGENNMGRILVAIRSYLHDINTSLSTSDLNNSMLMETQL